MYNQHQPNNTKAKSLPFQVVVLFILRSFTQFTKDHYQQHFICIFQFITSTVAVVANSCENFSTVFFFSFFVNEILSGYEQSHLMCHSCIKHKIKIMNLIMLDLTALFSNWYACLTYKTEKNNNNNRFMKSLRKVFQAYHQLYSSA